MAGAGYNLFNTGDVLTAAQVNTYLMQQSVMVFADSSARTTALSGVLAEGMMSYLQSDDKVYKYTGSSWVEVGGGGGADWSLLNSGGTTLSGSTTTVSGISNKDKILIIVTSATTNGAAALSATINSVSSGYYQSGYRLVSGSPYSTGNYVGFSTTTGSSIAFASPGSSGTAVHGSIMITGGNSTGLKTYQVTAGPDTVTDGVYRSYQGIVAEAATISSVSLTTGNSFTGGKIYVFASA